MPCITSRNEAANPTAASIGMVNYKGAEDWVGAVQLVLDEPNASLDALGEQALNAAIAAIKERGSTVVIIAHRPSLMAHVDVVAVLNDGS